MASAAVFGQGTLIKLGDGGSPENFTTVAEVSDIQPAFKGATIDVTNHDSTGGWEEFIAGLLSGTIKITINFIPTSTTQGYTSGILKDMYNRTKRNYKLVFPDGGSTTWAFTVIVTDYSPKAPVKDRLTADISMQITGAPTLA